MEWLKLKHRSPDRKLTLYPLEYPARVQLLTRLAVEECIGAIGHIRQISSGIASHCSTALQYHDQIGSCCDNDGKDRALWNGFLGVLEKR